VAYSAPWLVALSGLSWSENHKINDHQKAADEGRLDCRHLGSFIRTLQAARSGVGLT